MRGLKKDLCVAMEKATVQELTRCLGEPKRFTPTDPRSDPADFPYEWEFPLGDSGVTVSVKYYPDTWKAVGHRKGMARTPWLPCKVSNRHKLEDYRLQSGHRLSGYNSLSGKANLHSFDVETVDDWLFDLARHLTYLAVPNSPQWEAFGAISWENDNLTRIGIAA